MADWDFTGWEASAASTLVHLVDARLSASWIRHDDGPGMWRWDRTDEETEQRWIVAVNGREDRILVPAHGWPAKVGPTVMACRFGDPFVSVTLPHVSDRFEARRALAILANVVPELGEVPAVTPRRQPLPMCVSTPDGGHEVVMVTDMAAFLRGTWGATDG